MAVSYLQMTAPRRLISLVSKQVWACLAGFAIIINGAGSSAEQLSTRNRLGLLDSQLGVLSDRAAQQYNDSVRLQPSRIYTPSKWGPGPEGPVRPYTGAYNGPFALMARQAARRYAIPEDLFLRLVQQESGWNANALSHKGAIGLAQLMPGTARYLNVNPNDPRQNLLGGARYLREQFDTFGSWRLALAAYNAGPQAVERYKGIPPYTETKNYVRIIWGS
ncbi:MAG: lytic transglycosylase domain-containing protein [Pseudoprimorskyibacter sp.]|nr:lytic transglycosylase domain-containing protein [Pseudoprimorskyibacter sp.]